MYSIGLWLNIIRSGIDIWCSMQMESLWAKKQIRKIEKQFAQKFDKSIHKKIVIGYTVYSKLMCEAFTQLRGRKLLRLERVRLFHYFICSALFDDFSDVQKIDRATLYQLSFAPEAFEPKTFEEKVFRYAHLFLLNQVKDKTAYLEIAHQIFDAQWNSKKQFETHLHDDEIHSITLDKGAYSVYISHFYLDIDSTEEEKALWLHTGKIIQLTNDLYDLSKDFEAGVHTLATRIQDIYTFELLFNQYIDENNQIIHQLGVEQKVKVKLIIALSAIKSFGLVAIRHFKKIQGNQPQFPPLKSLTRKHLVVDMQLLKNMLYWLYCIHQNCLKSMYTK